MLNQTLAIVTRSVAGTGGRTRGSFGRRAFFDFSAPSYFNEGMPVLMAFTEAGWNCSVMLEWSGQGAGEARRKCRDLGCTIIELPDELIYSVESVSRQVESDRPVDPIHPTPSTSVMSRRRFFQWLAHYLPPVARIAELLWSVPKLIRLRRFGESLVRSAAPDVVLFGPFNSYGRVSNAIFAAAKKFEILRICMPCAPLMGEPYQILERFESLRQGVIGPQVRADYDLFNHICSIVLRPWTRINGKLRLFHRNPVEIIAGRLLGLNFTDGWQKPSPYFDIVFVPCVRSHYCLRIANFPMDRVIISGLPRMDSIIDSLRDERARCEFFQSIHLPVGAPFIVVNVEPAAEHYVTSWNDHWRLFRETMKAVTSVGVPVVLSLHPLCVPENYAFVESEYGAILRHPRNIYELVAHSSLVISFVCSTLLTTQIFNKPTIVYDYYGIPGGIGRFFDLREYVVCRDPGSVAVECRRVVNQLSAADQADSLNSIELPMASEIIRAEVDKLLARRSEHSHCLSS